ncbi:MAG: hypothetical protein AAF234_04965 [Pseudomonadota bacterium]
MAHRAYTPSLSARLSLARPMLFRAGLLGLCLGLVIVGLMENVARFGSPETLRSDARVAPSEVSAPIEAAHLREDRMHVVARAENPADMTLR